MRSSSERARCRLEEPGDCPCDEGQCQRDRDRDASGEDGVLRERLCMLGAKCAVGEFEDVRQEAAVVAVAAVVVKTAAGPQGGDGPPPVVLA
jgi:hypothetical protein